MNFNLGQSPAQTTSTGSYLQGDKIHTVKFMGVEAEEITGKTGDKFNTFKIKFAGEDGVFEDRVFEPRESDNVRRPNAFGGESPSNVDELIFKVRHLIAAVAPKVHEAIEKKGGLSVNGFSELVKFLVEKTKASIGTEVQIKLLKDKNGYARFPAYVLGFTKVGELFPRTNFIGQKLSFTAKEIERMNKITEATPTQMNDLDLGTSKSTNIDMDDDLDLDLESI